MIIAVGVFLVTYLVIASERFPRQAVAILGAVFLILIKTFSIQEALGFVDWETMGLLFGMFILVTMLAESGGLNWLAHEVAHRLDYRPVAIFIAFPLLAAFMAAFMDSITVMLFLSALTVQIATITKMDPIPLIIAEVCAANTGGSATLVGDPPNVILGTTLGFSFLDFVAHTGPIAIVATLTIVSASYFMNRKMLWAARAELEVRELALMDRNEFITDPPLLKLGLAGFLTAIFLLVTHSFLSPILNLSITSASAALLPALVVMLVGGEHTRDMMKKIDIETLLFFLGLFVIMGALEKTQFIATVARQLFDVAKGGLPLLMLLHWGAGFTSAVVDNVPMALAMAYIMKDMAQFPGAPALSIMTWALALGVDIGGNMTPIGASANVVAYAYTEKCYGKIGWGRWIKAAAPPTILAMMLISVLLTVKYFIGWY